MLDLNEVKKEQPLFQPEVMPEADFTVLRPDQVAPLTGLEQLEGIISGSLPAPPSARYFQQWITEVSKGRVEFRGDPSEECLNPMGMVHGGWTMALLDSALGSAVHSTLNAGEFYSSLGTEVKFIKPVLVTSGQLRAVSEVLSRGRRTATAQARLEDRQGQIFATGTTTCFIQALPGA